MWTNQQLSTVQLWKNIHFLDNDVESITFFPQPQCHLQNCSDYPVNWVKFFYKNDSLQWSKYSKLAAIRQKAKKYLQPMHTGKYNCTVMMMGNLANLEWLSVPCNDSLLKTIVCMSTKSNTAESSILSAVVHQSSKCPIGFVKYNDTCLVFQVVNKTRGKTDKVSFHQLCSKFGGPLALPVDMKTFDSAFPNVKAFSTLCFDCKVVGNECTTLEVNRFYPDYMENQWYQKTVSCKKARGLVVFEKDMTFVNNSFGIRSNIYQCSAGEVFSASVVCDGHENCRNGEDEKNCSCYFGVTTKSQLEYDSNLPTGSTCFLFSLFKQFCHSQCKSFLFQKKRPEENTFQCGSGQIILDRYLNDGFPDCVNDEDEVEFKRNILLGLSCKNDLMIPCFAGSGICFHVTHLCIHEVDQTGNILTCRNGFHLTNCRDFGCSVMHKCPYSYCIPNKFVCDGVWSCINGEDEINCLNKSCSVGWFRCKQSHICLPALQICDGFLDCPFNDDEILCGFACPKKCHCVNLAVSCVQLREQETKHVELSHYLFISLHQLQITQHLFISMVSASHLILCSSDVTLFCTKTQKKFPNLIHWSISNSFQSTLTRTCFEGLVSLRYFLLVTAGTKEINPGTFLSLPILRTLDLSHNRLCSLQEHIFAGLKSLVVLNLMDNPIVQLDVDTFDSLQSLQILNTSYFAICCMLSVQVVCKVKAEWPASCSDIIGNLTMKTILYFTFIGTLLLNLGSLFRTKLKRFLQKTQSPVNAYVITTFCVNMTDLFLSFYLGILLIADRITSGRYYSLEQIWRSSFVCHIAGCLSGLFSLLSPSVLLFLTLTRFLVIKYPFKSKYKGKHFIYRKMFMAFMISTCSTAFIWFNFYHVEGFKFHGLPLCNMIGDTQNSISIRVFTGTVIVIYSAVTIGICSLYSALVAELKAGKIRGNSKLATRTIVQIVVVSLSNILCWIPAAVIYSISLVWSEFPTDALTWTVVAVMPLNSVVNPIVFVTSDMFPQAAKSKPTSPRVY